MESSFLKSTLECCCHPEWFHHYAKVGVSTFMFFRVFVETYIFCFIIIYCLLSRALFQYISHVIEILRQSDLFLIKHFDKEFKILYIKYPICYNDKKYFLLIKNQTFFSLGTFLRPLHRIQWSSQPY